MAGTPVTDWVVDPAINADSGVGTLGDPFGDLQYALDQVGTSPGRAANGGDAFHVKSGTAEVMNAKLSIATYGTPALAGPLIIRGFTTSLYDGGVGQISGNSGTYPIFEEATAPAVHFQDLELYDCGSGAFVVRTGQNSSVINCEVHGCDGTGVSVGQHSVVANCHTYDLGIGSASDRAIMAGNNSEIVMCYYETAGTRRIGSFAIEANSNSMVEGCFVVLRHVSEGGILFAAQSVRAMHNLVLNIVNGTAIGMQYGISGNAVVGNILAGFAGTGGLGIQNQNPGLIALFRGNAFYNSAQDVKSTMESIHTERDAVVSSNPWARDGSLTFANRHTYFRLADIWPQPEDWQSLGVGYDQRDSGPVVGATVTSGDSIPRNHSPLLRM